MAFARVGRMKRGSFTSLALRRLRHARGRCLRSEPERLIARWQPPRGATELSLEVLSVDHGGEHTFAPMRQL